MKLVVGLGNPGEEYEKTRHNVGFMFLDFILNDSKFTLNKKNMAMEYETMIRGEKVLFIKPMTFMNDSGQAVIKYVNYYKIDSDDIIVIQDDLDMDLGKYKLLYNRGDGGHNGIKSIVSCLETRKFLRLKIGISKANIDTKDYVLGKFSKSELKIIDESFNGLKDFIMDYVVLNRDILVSKYNVKEKDKTLD